MAINISSDLLKKLTTNRMQKLTYREECYRSLHATNLSKTFHLPDIVYFLPSDLQSEESMSAVTYSRWGNTRNKILNYKVTVKSIYIDQEVSFTCNTTPSEWQRSKFYDPRQKHIITGDLRLIGNAKLRKHLIKGPNFREPGSLNFSKTLLYLLMNA